MAEVVSVNISLRRGTRKQPVPAIRLRPHYGIEGDAHAGNWHRQISLLSQESVDTMRALSPVPLDAGVFAENILTRGVDLKALPLGALLEVGDTLLRVTQIGKSCHKDCEIRQATGYCVMPTEGIFAVVVRGGTVRPGDPIALAKEAAS